jgi:hypothetical protein
VLPLLLLLLLLFSYRPENKKEKADRLKAEAAARESGKVCLGWIAVVFLSFCLLHVRICIGSAPVGITLHSRPYLPCLDHSQADSAHPNGVHYTHAFSDVLMSCCTGA